MERRLEMTIDGKSVTCRDRFEVVNPARGESFASAPDCPTELLDEAFGAAQVAHERWRRSEVDRPGYLRRAADVVEGAADEVARLLTAEQGKPLAQARGEALSFAAWFRYFADQELPRDTIRDDDDALVEVVRQPLGVVAAITPWNVPVTLASWKLAPTLRAGNTVVLKPSPFTPLSTLYLGELLRDVLPPGVINVVSGGDALGRAMTAHRVPRKVSFTGSARAGRSVAEAAAASFKRLTLELGGNDPAILLPDVDPTAIAERLFWSAFSNNGQVCAAVKRVYVHADQYDAVVGALASIATGIVVGDGNDPVSQLGPIATRPQFDRVVGLVDEARRAGSTVVAGGHALDRPGYFYVPTIIATTDDSLTIVAEEQFGPALPVLPYTDIDDAIHRANDTDYGLTASVWSADDERAASVGSRLQCGTLWVNTHLALTPAQPFGGVRSSGLGTENGVAALLDATDGRVIHRARGV